MVFGCGVVFGRGNASERLVGVHCRAEYEAEDIAHLVVDGFYGHFAALDELLERLAEVVLVVGVGAFRW